MGGLYEFVACFSFAIPKFLWIASIIYIYMYIIFKFKATKVRNVCRLNEN